MYATVMCYNNLQLDGDVLKLAKTSIFPLTCRGVGSGSAIATATETSAPCYQRLLGYNRELARIIYKYKSLWSTTVCADGGSISLPQRP